MDKKACDFLFKLCETPTPTGFELPGQRLFAEYVKPYADEISLDPHGNLIARLNPKAKYTVMLDGHCDEIGLIVQYIDEKGFIYVQPLGGIDTRLLLAERVVFQGANGKPVRGVVGMKPIHHLSAKERETAISKITDIWVDIGAGSREEALKHVEIGAPGIVESGVRPLIGDKISGRGMDDRAGAFIVMDVLRRLKGRKLNVCVCVNSATQEEVGCLGAQTAAFGIKPDAAIEVDVTFASDNPGGEPRKIGIVDIGGGPVVSRGPAYDPKLVKFIESTAKKSKIKVQTVASCRGNGTNAFTIRQSRAGVPVALVSLPLRYMHTPVEVVSLSDIDSISQLLADTVAAMPANPKFGFSL